MSSTNTGAVTASYGSFQITVKDADGVESTVELDIGTIMMSVNLDYVSLLDTQIASQISATVERNNQLDAATQLMEYLSDVEDADTTTADGAETVDWKAEVTINGETKYLYEWCDELGVDWDSGDDKVNLDIDNLKDDLQSVIDGLNDDSETASLQLQNLTEKRSNALLQASNLMSSAHSSTQTILGNY